MPYPGEQHAAITNALTQQAQYTAFTTDEVASLQCRLDKQLGPEYLQWRDGPGGTKLSYIPSHKVIQLANDIFGFNGWSSSIQNVHVDFCEESSPGKFTVGCSCIMRVTLKDGVYHEDIGYGEVTNAKTKAAALEKTKKEAATDALKRAMRNFGNVLGNCVYDKSHLEKVKRLKAVPAHWDADDLHRPASAMAKVEPAIKQEVVQVNNDSRAQMQYGNQDRRHEEDEFGADDFDEIDFNADHTSVSRSTNLNTIDSAAFTTISDHKEPNARLQGHVDSTASNASAVQAKNEPREQEEVPIPQNIPPMRFYRASAAPHLQEENPTLHSEELKVFDPRTPSNFKHSTGVDHSRSGPVPRDAVHAPRPGAASTPNEAARTTRSMTPNYVNPQADMNRRIGFPGSGMPSPHSNRGTAFRPPASINKRALDGQHRTALSDVSNVLDTNRAESPNKKLKVIAGPESIAENTTKTG